MASTYSPLKIQLMATGENSATWGTVTNVNLGTAIEEMIAGSADVTFASAQVTLTLTDVNTTQTARNMRLNLTGTSGGAQNLIVPAVEKLYVVNNGCADAITVKNATGTGIAVPAGKSLLVYNNATNVVDAVTHLTSLTLGAALPVASGGTGITALGTGVAIALGVNTGSAGAFVVNGGVLGTPSSGTVTNLTGTASINTNGAHNGTVGATTPASGAFTTITTTDTIIGTKSGSNAAYEWKAVNANAGASAGVGMRFTNNAGDAGISVQSSAYSGFFPAANATTIYSNIGGIYLATYANYSIKFLVNSAGTGEAGLVGSITTTGLNGMNIGATTPGTVAATTLSATGLLDLSGASAGQIKFPATQNASSNANTLDDYEEGTFTPGCSFGGGTTGITYGASTGGDYVKIGKSVTYAWGLVLTAKGSSTGDAKVTGFPFTNYNGTASRYAVGTATSYVGSMTLTGRLIVASFSTGSTTTLDVGYENNGSTGLLTDTAFANNTNIYGTTNIIATA